MTSSDALAQNTPRVVSDFDSPEEGMGLVEFAVVLVRHKRLLLILPIVTAVLAFVVSFLLPNIFTATTMVLPPQSGQSSSMALLAQLGGVMGGAGSGIPALKNPADLYVGMLKSRTIADALIRRFDLNQRYDQSLQSKTRKQLESNTIIRAGKDGIITIEVDDHEPGLAADMANGYVEELFKLTNVMAVTEASQRRLFFERQLSKAKTDLAAAESAARAAIQSGGLVKVDEQGRALLETTARLRAKISTSAVQIDAMRTYAAARNPELLLAQQELEAAKRELGKLEGASGTGEAGGASAAGQGVGNLALLRDIKYNEAVFDFVAKQLELAKIDEAKDSSLLQVIDSAVAPDRRSRPKRLLIVLVSTLTAIVAACVWVLIQGPLSRVRGAYRQAQLPCL